MARIALHAMEVVDMAHLHFLEQLGEEGFYAEAFHAGCDWRHRAYPELRWQARKLEFES